MSFFRDENVSPVLLKQIWEDAVADVRNFENEVGQGSIKKLIFADDEDQLESYDGAFSAFARHAVGEKYQVRKFPAYLGKMAKIENGFVSWLLSIGGDELRITVDHERLIEALPSRISFRMARILLHEIAHIKYHYSYCFPGESTGIARSCLDYHEGVAWLYASIITGFALGQFSNDSRANGKPDIAWTLL